MYSNCFLYILYTSIPLVIPERCKNLGAYLQEKKNWKENIIFLLNVRSFSFVMQCFLNYYNQYYQYNYYD